MSTKKQPQQSLTAVNNWVAKNSHINKASTHVDKKKQEQTPRKQKYNKIDY